MGREGKPTAPHTQDSTMQTIEVGDTVRVKLPSGAIVRAEIQSFTFVGFLALVEGETSARIVTHSMIVGGGE